MTMPDAINNFMSEAMSARAQAIETACEAAIQSGSYGVRVRSGWQRTDDGDMCYVVEARVDHTVPYGFMVEDECYPPDTGDSSLNDGAQS